MNAGELIAKLASARVAVIGDLMLDHYVSGRVSRISDEAPIPILHVESERWTAGGAANVAANIAALGGTPRLAGLVGSDPEGDRLTRLLSAECGVSDTGLLRDGARPTTRKTRYLGGRQQIVRVDREAEEPLPAGTEDALIGRAKAALADCPVLVLSDYGKGVLSDRVLGAVFAEARRLGRTVIVDPKRRDLSAYAGADYITPNRRELTLSVGHACDTDEEAAAAAALATEASGAAILLTRSERGMSLFRQDLPPAHLAAEAQEVFDVSGAGDTVVAAFAMGLAAGLDPERAMAVANAAAGVVVGKHGTAVVTPPELAAKLSGDFAVAEAGAASRGEAVERRAAWKAQGLTVGFTNGCFDILHPGHVSLLEQAAAECDRLIVALNTDASVSRLKGPTRPIQPLDARARVVGALRGVAMVVAFDEDTPLELIGSLVPDVLVKGADYAEADVVGGDVVKAAGGRVVRADLVAGQSTTAIVERGAG